MSEPSQQSSTLSKKAGRDSLNRLRELQAGHDRRKAARKEPVPVPASTPSLKDRSRYSIPPEEIERMKVERTRREAAERFAATNVPKRHADVTEFRQHDTWGLAFKDEVIPKLLRGSILALLGARGTGKTQLAVEAIRYLSGNSKRCHYVKAALLFLAMRRSAHSEGSEESVIAHYVKQFDLLVIDEVGNRGQTPWENRMLTLLLDCRYDAVVDTIVISNETPEDLAGSIGASVMSRLSETGCIIECDWESFR